MASLSQTVAAAQLRKERGSVVEESWVIRRFFPENHEDVLRHIALLKSLKRTGTITLNLSQGTVASVEYRERGPSTEKSDYWPGF